MGHRRRPPWYQHGLGTCRAVEDASAAIADNHDPVGQFLDDACTLDPGKFTPAAELARAYGAWAQQNRQPEIGAKKLGDGLTRHGLVQAREYVEGKRQRCWRGIALAADAPIGTGRDGSSRTFPSTPPRETSGTIRPGLSHGPLDADGTDRPTPPAGHDG